MNAEAPRPEENRGMRSRSAGFSTSGYMTPALLALLCAGLIAAAYERGHGHLHQIKEAVGSPAAPVSAGPNAPGGQDAIRLTRTASNIGTQPEFLSATLLPGRGLEILQITASIPGHGEVPLLFAPSLSDARDEWKDTGIDAHGEQGAHSGAAFLLPWARTLNGQTGPQADSLETSWNGQKLVVPAAAEGRTESTQGLILDRGVEGVKTSVLPDGQALEATLHGGALGGTWPSTVDVDYAIKLTGQALEITVRATNTGSQPIPMGIGWKPHFAIPGGDRGLATVVIPSSTLSARDPRSGAPTGRTNSTSGTGLDFVRAAGTALGSRDIDATYTDLLRSVSGDGPIAQLSDPAYNYTLRLIALSPSIQRLHLEAPTDKPWVVLEADTNDDDPTGPEWAHPQDSGLVTLAPGASLLWKVRVEIATLAPL